jgi:hypothetical protein
MAEHESVSAHVILERAAQAVGGTLFQSRDLAHGESVGLSVEGPHGPQLLEVFTSDNAVRVSGPLFRLEVVGTFTPHVQDDRVWVTDESPEYSTTVGLRSDGSVIFTYTARAAEEPRTAGSAEAEPSVGIAPESRPEGPTTPQAACPGTALAQSGKPDVRAVNDQAPESKERGILVSFTGRLGRDPLIFDRNGEPRVKLAVGEHYFDADTQEEKTRWHEVWTARTNAETVAKQTAAKQLRRGTEVRVRGYEHPRAPKSDGKMEPPFVRAFQITPLKKAPPPKA